MEGGAAFHDEGRAGMMREDKHGHVIDGVLTPPAAPAFIGPRAAHGAEHVAAHDPGAHVVKTPRRKVFVDARLAVGFAEELGLECARGKGPGVERGAADAQRVFEALVRTGGKAVEGKSEAFDAEFGHEGDLCGVVVRCMVRRLISYFLRLFGEVFQISDDLCLIL